MLVLSRKIGETIVIDGRITITVVGFRNRQIKIGIVAPSETRVLRGELAPFAPSSTAAGSVSGKPTVAASGPQAAQAAEVTRKVKAANAELIAEATEAADFDPTLLATADGLVCESFAAGNALGAHRDRYGLESDSECDLECDTEIVWDDNGDGSKEGSEERASSMVLDKPTTAIMAAKPARPRRALGLRGFRETRRTRTMAGTSSIGSAALTANRAATEQPAAVPGAGHSERATAG
jgi:carbon storage regulator